VPRAPHKPELPIHEFPDQAAWERWLEVHHGDSAGVRLKFAKKGSAHRTVNYAEALEVALCFGWIDGQVGRFDADFYLQRFTPRTKRSKWSQINVEKATALIEAGRMRPAGSAAVEAAQADGRWDEAYPPASRAAVPEDFQAALDAAPRAAEFFAGLTGSNRYAFLYRLHHVTDPARRAARIADYLERLSTSRTLTD
jgi:uncharacterized protein YdeI (YjbR/CyaY-like superfamily)